jgi:hypothetical protein
MLFFGTSEHGFRTATQDVQTGWSGLAVADLNGDGKDDIIVTNKELDGSGKASPDTVTILFSK